MCKLLRVERPAPLLPPVVEARPRDVGRRRQAGWVGLVSVLLCAGACELASQDDRTFEVPAPMTTTMPPPGDPNGAAGSAGTASAGVSGGGAGGIGGAAGTTAGSPAIDASTPTDTAVPEPPDAGPPDAGATQDAATAAETGRLVGMTAAHNAVRARMHDPAPSPALEPLTWSASLAATAQAYADSLAATCAFAHSMAPGLGENLAQNQGWMSNPTEVTEGWAAEEACYTYGTFFGSDDCDAVCVAGISSNGCGHYTQVVWRNTTELGCGFATCSNGTELWVCNYTPPGNYVGMLPY